ncbi:MAG: carboxymuconolactone decarboxylase family protein [Leptospiraceae bacterium]|nr:carboxymuconolactone decarboxylase family protein [Leptospiraceae bacterium]
MNKFKTKLNPEKEDTESKSVQEIFITTKKNLGTIPNMYKNMGVSSGLLSTYIHGYTELRGSKIFKPHEMEVIFLTISKENACDYCLKAHSFIGRKMTSVPEDVIQAIHTRGSISDHKLNALHEFVVHYLNSKGWLRPEEVEKFTDAGFPEEAILEIILAISVKTISNYSNHIFDTEIDSMFKN